MDEYNASPLYSGNDDFDGSWAIWDEPFFKFYAHKMDEFSEPFVTAMFSASSHHPFAIPGQYKDIYKEGKLPIHKCVQYTDNALRAFFAHAKEQEWFKNTLFVITADHSNQTLDARYKSSSGFFEVPIIFYDPAGKEPFAPSIDSTLIAQQNGIMPTLLHYVGYKKDFLSFGKSLLSDTPQESYAVNWLGGLYQYFKGDYLLQFDGERSTAIIDVRKDPLHQNNLIGTLPEVEEQMQRELKAIIQQYMARMLQDRLVPENDNKEE
jgi:phosphoglycerol transferase MdoB-like AlkP superfamily enzyme